jgi:hypothetical protein
MFRHARKNTIKEKLIIFDVLKYPTLRRIMADSLLRG